MATFDLGRVTPIYRREYSATASYELNDVVLYEGNLYWHVQATATVGIAPTDTTVWKLAFSDEGVRAEIRGYADDAQVSKTAAAQSASQASASASSAQASASQAASSAQSAQTAEGNASASASAAATSATNSAASAQSAASSAQTATDNATLATNKAQAASESASLATAKANAAATSETNAAASAQTASAKASEAAASATSAQEYDESAQASAVNAQTAQGLAETAQTAAETAQTAAETAQGLAEDARDEAQQIKDDVEDAIADKADSAEIGDLSQLTTTAKNNLVSAVTEINGRLTEYDNLIYNVNPNANGEFIFPLRTDGYWESSDGPEAFHKVSNAGFVSNRFPISVKAGDTIHIKDGINVRFFALFSADGETWTTLTTTTNRDKAIAADGLVLVSVRKEPRTLSFSDDDVRLFFEKYLTIYRRSYSNALVEAKNNIDNAAGIIINDISYCQGYVTSSESTTQINMQIPANVPCTYGETIYISAKLGVTHPEYYGSIALSVIEKNSSSGPIRVTNYTDLSNTIEYVVGEEATISLYFVVILTKQSTDSVLVGFYENVDYSLCVYKPIKSGDDISDVMTESGDTWEV